MENRRRSEDISLVEMERKEFEGISLRIRNLLGVYGIMADKLASNIHSKYTMLGLSDLHCPVEIEKNGNSLAVAFTEGNNTWGYRSNESNHVTGDTLYYDQKDKNGDIAEFGAWNLSDSARILTRSHPNVKVVNVFEKFDSLLSDFGQ
jgi:hypothetical protein